MTKSTTLPVAIIIFFCWSIFLPTGCIEDTLGKEEAFKEAVDTLYKRKIKTFVVELDSICEMQMDSLIQYNIDSIKERRIKEIEKLLKDGNQIEK